MNEILIFGHKSPDTDSICSSIALANLKQKLGVNAKAVRLGVLSKETKYVLNHFGVLEQPMLSFVEPGTEVILVDHNEKAQSIDGIDDAEIIEIIDHHRTCISTPGPIFYRCEPIGCTCTIVAKMYKEKGVTPSREMAGLMLSAILSDTLIFKSPTCTNEDKEMALELAKIAGVECDIYGKEMIIAGASIEGEKIENVLTADIKMFEFGEKKVLVSQVMSAGIDNVLKKKDEILSSLDELRVNGEADTIVLILTDILLEGSELICVGKDAATIEQAFGVVAGNSFLPGVLSRKKQIIPKLTTLLG